MRFNVTAAVAGLCLLIAGLVQADTVPVTWSNPTANTNGSALPVSSITRTTIIWAAVPLGEGIATTGTKVVLGSATSTTIELPPGTWYVGARTTANGNDSGLSNVIQRVVVQPTPNPPVLSVVPVVAGLNMSPAYKILADGKRSEVVAGFVRTGTACSGPVIWRYRSKDYRRVPRASVTWWNTPWTTEVAAPCA